MTRWVVIDAVEQKMKCLRCGCTRPTSILTGKILSDAVAIMNGFVAEHKNCENRTAL